MTKSESWQKIPTNLSVRQFEQFVLPCLTKGSRGPETKLPTYKIFNYILKLLHTGCQWEELPIDLDENGCREIHHTRIYRAFRRWEADGCMDVIFENSVFLLHKSNKLDVSVIHGDGRSNPAKKGGDNLGFNDHKHFKGDKVVAFCDRNCNIIAPFITAPGNRNEHRDGGYDCQKNRKAIFNRGMVPNINENKRNIKTTKRGRKPLFKPAIFKERFETIERVFAWEDKFKRLLLRFERISGLPYALKTLAYTMINLRHFCQA